MKGRLSEHLTWEVFADTSHREFMEEQENPDPQVVANARRWAVDIYEPLLNLWGLVRITSGYRCFGLNECVGGHPESAHVEGRAADVKPQLANIVDAFEQLLASQIPFDKAILEFGRWVHVQNARRGGVPRRQGLVTFDGRNYAFYDPRLEQVKKLRNPK